MLGKDFSCCLCLASWLVGEREIHALSHYHSLTTPAFNHNQRKTLFSCNFVQNLTARESKVTVVEKVEDNVFFVPSLFALIKRCLLLWWLLLCPQTINITPWKGSRIAHFTSHIRPDNEVGHDKHMSRSPLVWNICVFSVKINISTMGGFRVGFFQPDTNHPWY